MADCVMLTLCHDYVMGDRALVAASMAQLGMHQRRFIKGASCKGTVSAALLKQNRPAACPARAGPRATGC